MSETHKDNCGFALYGPPAICICGNSTPTAQDALLAADEHPQVIAACLSAIARHKGEWIQLRPATLRAIIAAYTRDLDHLRATLHSVACQTDSRWAQNIARKALGMEPLP